MSASGQEIVIDVPRPLSTLRSLAKLRRWRRTFGLLASQLRASGLRLTVTRRGRPIARIGARVVPSVLTRLIAGTPYVALGNETTKSRGQLSNVVIAGLAGSLAMDLVQDGFAALFERNRADDDRDEETEAIVGVVKRIAPIVPFDLARSHPGPVGRVIHYVFGCAFAVGYVAARKRMPSLGIARGVPFGIGLWFLSDVVLIPIAKLGKPVWRYSAGERANALLSHIAYATVVEAALTYGEA